MPWFLFTSFFTKIRVYGNFWRTLLSGQPLSSGHLPFTLPFTFTLITLHCNLTCIIHFRITVKSIQQIDFELDAWLGLEPRGFKPGLEPLFSVHSGLFSLAFICCYIKQSKNYPNIKLSGLDPCIWIDFISRNNFRRCSHLVHMHVTLVRFSLGYDVNAPFC